MELERVRRVALSEVVLEQLLALMRQGKLKPGDAPRPTVGDSDTAELDELFTFVGGKKTKPTSSPKSTGKRGAS